MTDGPLAGGYSATRAIEALEILARGPTTISALSEQLQVHPRTARRLLTRLVADGYLERDAKFSPTDRLRELGDKLARPDGYEPDEPRQ